MDHSYPGVGNFVPHSGHFPSPANPCKEYPHRVHRSRPFRRCAAPSIARPTLPTEITQQASIPTSASVIKALVHWFPLPGQALHTTVHPPRKIRHQITAADALTNRKRRMRARSAAVHSINPEMARPILVSTPPTISATLPSSSWMRRDGRKNYGGGRGSVGCGRDSVQMLLYLTSYCGCKCPPRISSRTLQCGSVSRVVAAPIKN